MGEPTREDRIAGGVLGVHAGDSLGAGVEFDSWATIRDRYPDGGPREITGGGAFNWPAGHATDDTDLTRAVLLACLEPGDDVVRAAADHMLDWLHGRWPGRTPGQYPKDIGGATRSGLVAYEHSGDPRDAGAGEGSAGNGSLMRCIPTAFTGAGRDRRMREAVDISAVTHDDERCTASCAAYVEIVASLLDGSAPADAVAAGERAATELHVPTVVDAIRFGRTMNLPMAAKSGVTGLADGGGGFVLDSLSLAVAAVLDPRPFEDVVVDVVRTGRDTDTNGAIAGGLAGVRDGVGGIPERWVSVLQFRAEFLAAAGELAGRG